MALLSACKKENRFDCLKSTGESTKELRLTSSFNGLDISDNMNVYITESEDVSVLVEAGENIIGNIKTEVRKGTLFLSNNNKCNWVRDYDKEVNIYISSNKINNISYRGFGEVKTLGNYSSRHFFVDMWMASGNMALHLNCDTVYLKSHTGPANIDCDGSTKYLIVYMNGTGVIDAGKLRSDNVLAINRDVGDVYVQAIDLLNAEIYSRGDIFYKGDVKEINLDDLGEGELINY